MNKLKIANRILMAVLGVASGASKVLKAPQEIDFFHGEMGFSVTQIVIFGALQLIAGVMILFGKSRLAGAVVLAVTYVISAIIVFMSGKTAFGFVSLLPVILVAFIIKDAIGKPPTSATEGESES